MLDIDRGALNPHILDYCKQDVQLTIESCKKYYEQEMLNNSDWNLDVERLTLTKLIMKYTPSEDWKRCFYKKDLIIANVAPHLQDSLKRDIIYTSCPVEEVLDEWLEEIKFEKLLANARPTTMS